MASYLDKQNQKKMATESGKIAFALELMDRYPDLKPKFGVTVELYDGYSAVEDTWVWVIYKHNGLGDCWYKVVPNHEGSMALWFESTKGVLEHQPWVYL